VPLSTGTGRSGLAGVPEDLFALQAHDVVGIDAHVLEIREGVVVFFPDGDPEAVGFEAQLAFGLWSGEEVPRELNRAFLEVVAEREIAQHLKERAVPGRLADFFDVLRADALLHRGDAGVRRRL